MNEGCDFLLKNQGINVNNYKKWWLKHHPDKEEIQKYLN